jgi:D-alanine-D-alanine ligase
MSNRIRNAAQLATSSDENRESGVSISSSSTWSESERTPARTNRGNGNGNVLVPRNSAWSESGRAGARAHKPNGANIPRTWGPVSDLENHLPPEWWRTLFNAVYLKTDGDVVENHKLTEHEVDLIIDAIGIGKSDRVLDLCCGQGRHTMELVRRGYTNVTGIDRSRYLVRLAKRRAGEQGLNAVFREGDARKSRLPEDSFDCVLILGNSFGYFDHQEDDKRVIENVARWLRPGGTIVLDIADGEWLRGHFEPRSWEWVDQEQFVCRERSLSSDGSRLISREVVVDAEKGVIADQFYAERLYSRSDIETLLKIGGFSSIRFHGEHATSSDRNQDLGMMARRLVITAVVAKQPRRTATRHVPFPEVTVILGDPRLPDGVKLNGRFNTEDFATVDKLKTALGRLAEYRFRYLDDHASLLTQLQNERPAFVLNLCDEGYNNDAFRELHVPAYLELLGIPYSGSGPACLGLCYDKSLVNSIAQTLDVPVPLQSYVDADDIGGTIPSVFPALIKPAQGDSSLGITQNAVVDTPEEAVRYLTWLRNNLPGRPALVQEFLSGAEYTVTIIGNPGLGYTTLPVLEVDYSQLPRELPPILSYESKWQPESPYWTAIRYREAQASESMQRALVDFSSRLFERLGCRDYARFDFRCDVNGEPKLLEVNPNPGWCWDGKMNIMASMAGYSYRDLLRLILDAAQQRVYVTNGLAISEAGHRVAGQA